LAKNKALPVGGPSKGDKNTGYYLSASPLLLAEPKKSTLNPAAMSNPILLARIKESNFNSNNILSADTDYLQQQYLS
jgi:hypothetical protein